MSRTVRYGILDDAGEVVRWVDTEPNGLNYVYLEQRVPRQPKRRQPTIDWLAFEPALL